MRLMHSTVILNTLPRFVLASPVLEVALWTLNLSTSWTISGRSISHEIAQNHKFKILQPTTEQSHLAPLMTAKPLLVVGNGNFAFAAGNITY